MEGYEFLQCEDGIYFAKPLKNGNISKKSYKVTDKDIVNLFLNYLKRYCMSSNNNLLEITNDKDETIMEAKLHVAAFS